MGKAWERDVLEGDEAFEAFGIYRDMGPERSLAAVGQKLSKSLPLMKRWSAEHRWTERASEYDNHLDGERRKQAERDIKDMAKRHASQAMMFQQKVIERLRTLDAGALSPADLSRWFDIAVKVERISRGEPDTIQQSTVYDSEEVKRIRTQYAALAGVDPGTLGAGEDDTGQEPEE